MTALELDMNQVAGVRAKRSSRLRPWQMVYVRDITREDLLLLAQTGNHIPDKPTAPLAKIREQHHMMAQYAAQGKDHIEIARIVGYSPARIQTLFNDPGFNELVVYYQDERDFATADVTVQVRNMALTAGQILAERMENEPESFTNEDLRKLMGDTLDRAGYGPSSTVRVVDSSKVIAALGQAMATEVQSRVIPRAEIEASFEVVNGQISPPSSHEPLESGDET